MLGILEKADFEKRGYALMTRFKAMEIFFAVVKWRLLQVHGPKMLSWLLSAALWSFQENGERGRSRPLRFERRKFTSSIEAL